MGAFIITRGQEGEKMTQRSFFTPPLKVHMMNFTDIYIYTYIHIYILHDAVSNMLAEISTPGSDLNKLLN